MSDSELEPASRHLPATAEELGLETGLDDFDNTDMVVPRLSIDQENATFVDNLTGEEHPKLRAVLLGFIKGRILWDKDVKEGEGPMCKSYDGKVGVPNLATFPLSASGFDSLPVAGETLPCDACSLTEWGSHPTRDIPWCSEQHTYPLLMESEEGSESYTAPAILTVQRSAIKASKAYLTGFARRKTPVFTVVTELSLEPQKKGSVKYAVPKFVKIGQTDQEDWRDYAEQYRSIREFIQTPPSRSDDAEAAEPKVSSPGTSEAASDDDLPF